MAKRKARIDKTCECCGKQFSVLPCQSHVRTCSTACGYKVRKVANKKEWVQCTCANCGKSFLAVPCHAGRRVFCSKQCQEASPATKQSKTARWIGRENVTRKAVSNSGKPYHRMPADREAAKQARRRAALLRATTPWADQQEIAEFYRAAVAVTEQTGIEHEVDHILPLRGRYVSGLHVPANLQVIRKSDNRSKGNRHST